MDNFDFCGWATRANIKCADGRTILRDAFKHCDGQIVPLVWNHNHNDPFNVLGHALLQNRPEGVYTYGKFNDSESGKMAKLLVENGDVKALSIYANGLKQNGGNVLHGAIREVSLVLAGANPGANIESIIRHDADSPEEFIFWCLDEDSTLKHGVDIKTMQQEDYMDERTYIDDYEEFDDDLMHSATVQDVIDSMNETQQQVFYGMIAQAIDDTRAEYEDYDDEEGDDDVKHNIFYADQEDQGNVLTHAAQGEILALAKQTSIGSLKTAINIYAENNASLAHGIDEIETLFPEFHNLNPGAPELIRPDQTWVMSVINKISKSPFSRIRTRQADARIAELRAKGYQQKGDEKTISANIKLLGRTTDPQTVYRKDSLHRDDIVDITDFDVVAYNWGIMKDNMYEELAMAALVGDRREEGDPDKIHETHIRSIWNDEELYTIHVDVDIEAARNELQGTNTNAHFGENYIYAEAIITQSLYAREKFKGSGRPDLYCTPHLVNVMLLARDLNGRRIYDSKSDLAKALNVGEIVEIEQFEGLTRKTEGGETKALLGLYVNLHDYQFGSTKGGEITRFEDFDIDFNQYKYLMETRLSGALVKPFAAIALEEPVETEETGE